MKVIKNNKVKVNGTLWDWSDSTLIVDNDTIPIAEIVSLSYTPMRRKKLSRTIRVTGYTAVGLGALVGIYSLATYPESEGYYGPIEEVFIGVGLFYFLNSCLLTIYGISHVVKYKKKFKIGQDGWQLIVA